MSRTLTELGGVARRAELVRACGRPAVDRALATGELVVAGRRYVSPELGRARTEAAAVSGLLSRRSAALDWGWGVLTRPERTEVLVPRKRKVAQEHQRTLAVHWAEVGPDDVVDGRTSQERTLLDCLRTLPFAEALAVADSALREGFSRSSLLAIARDARGPGSARVREVAPLADARSANPFESALRAICLGVDGLEVEPQVPIYDPRWLGRPDLVDRRLRIVLEADSFEWHGDRAALARDARRYNGLVVAGWLVLRFTWEEVTFHPDRVREVLQAAVRERAHQLCSNCRAA